MSIWQLQSGREPIEISTKSSGVEKQFYGKDGDLEAAIANYENRFAPCIKHILDGAGPNDYAELLAMLVWTQAIRTKAMRQTFGEAIRRTA